MKRETLAPDTLAPPAGHFSHGVITEGGRTLYVAGQTPVDEEGNLVCPATRRGRRASATGTSKKWWRRPAGEWRIRRKSRSS